MGRYSCLEPSPLFHYYSLVFFGFRETDKSLPATDWMTGTVLRCWENPNTHSQVSLPSLSFFLSFCYFVIQQHTLLPYSFSIFYVCWLAGWLPCISYSCATTGERKTPDCDGCASLARRHWHWKEPGRKINDERAGYADSFFISLPVSLPPTNSSLSFSTK